jgi:HK97 family phage portal protein
MFGKGRMIDELRSQVDELRAQATLWGNWSGQSVSTWAGIDVDREQALRLLAVYGSVRMITDGISTMPVDVFRKKADGTSESLSTPMWLDEPMVGLPFTEWCSQVLTSLLLDGNSFFVVMRNERNAIVELIPLANDSVSVRRDKGRKVYVVAGVEYQGEIVHIKAMMLAGSDLGLSPVEYARQTIGLGLAAQKFGAEFFDGPGNMPGVIEAPKPVQPELMQATTRSWQKFRRQGGQGLPAMLQDGMTFKPTGVTNEQAQFLETRQWSAAEIAGQMFLLDPSDLGIPVSGTSLTYGNLVERDTRRVKVAYLPWMVRIERALSALLFNPRFMKFNQDALLRGDLKSQYEAFNIALAGQPFLAVDEVRDTIDRGPLPASEQPPAMQGVPDE